VQPGLLVFNIRRRRSGAGAAQAFLDRHLIVAALGGWLA
jgi:hypothetical protein